jgi:hypothetical protein
MLRGEQGLEVAPSRYLRLLGYVLAHLSRVKVARVGGAEKDTEPHRSPPADELDHEAF